MRRIIINAVFESQKIIENNVSNEDKKLANLILFDFKLLNKNMLTIMLKVKYAEM